MTQRRQRQTQRRKVTAKFVKAPLCPTVYPDGAWGSVTPQGNIHMALYSEAAELPTLTYEIDSENPLQAPKEVPQPISGVVREIQAVIILSPGVAVAVRAWLDQQIGQALQMQALVRAGIERQLAESSPKSEDQS